MMRGGAFALSGTTLLAALLAPVLCAAELPPYRPYKGPIRPGLVITRDNLPQYEAELKKLLPRSRWYYLEGVRRGIITMPIVKARYMPPSKGFIEMTKKHGGEARVGPNNQLLDWVAGAPFPYPKSAVELAWDICPDTVPGSSHDDLEFYSYFYFFSPGWRYEKYFKWVLLKKRYMGRCDIPPIPCMPEAKTKGILNKESMLILEPHETRGFSMIRTRFWDVRKDDECYSYIPAIRRIRRLTGADVTDPLLGSDTIYDDFEVWRQKLNWRMTFRVLEHRDYLVPRIYTKKPPYDRKKHGPVVQVEWELRPQWVLEINTNDPDYCYSKRVVYAEAAIPGAQPAVTACGAHYLYWGEMYDQRGRLWRANGPVAPCGDGHGFKNLFNWMFLNYLSGHFTLMDGYPTYGRPEFKPLDPREAFTVRGLLRRAH